MIRAVVFACCCLFAQLSHAVIGVPDNVPGSTLLFPYFEADPTAQRQVDTQINITNTSATAMMLNVTLWTDYGLPTNQFNVYLTGYDTETISMNQLMRRIVPRTASAGQDPTDTISNKGPISQDINFASCGQFLPEPETLLLGPNLALAHQGISTPDYFGGNCGARAFGDGIARGFITVDTINQCTRDFPNSPIYSVNTVLTVQNVLMGSYIVTNRTTGRVDAEAAISIEGDFVDPIVATPGNRTFYGLFNGNNALDRREPLPTAFVGQVANGKTSFEFWREPRTTTGAPLGSFACGSAPANVPVTQRQVSIFDANGVASGSPTGNLFPMAAGRSAFAISPASGTGFFNLNIAAGEVRQSWLNFRQVPLGAPSGANYGYTTSGIAVGFATPAGPNDPTNP